MRTKVLCMLVAAVLALGSAGTALAQDQGGQFGVPGENPNVPPTAGNRGADPNSTADPAAVAAAQKTLVQFYDYTNRNWSIQGYSSAAQMRELLGNSQSSWLDQSLALARGRLSEGWDNQNWIPNRGWCFCR